MILSLGEVCSTASKYCGGRLDYTMSEVSMYANMALTEVTVAVHHRGKEALAIAATVAGESRLPMPQQAERILGITLSKFTGTSVRTLTEESVLTYVDQHVMDSRTSQSGRPEYWTEYNGVVQVYPVPDSAYSLTMRHVERHHVLTSSASTPNLDARYAQPWLMKTAELLADARRDHATALYWGQKYTAYMEKMPSDNAWQMEAKAQQGLQLLR